MEEVARFFAGSMPNLSNLQPIAPVEPTTLVLIKQNSPSVEKITKNGHQKEVHVVIKNSPFVIHLGTNNNSVDFNHVAFDATLLYDVDGEKGVDFVKDRPVQFKALPTEKGDQVNVELRIKVLTSQHEDMFFKVRIQGYDPLNNQEIVGLKVITLSIKVISKPEQLKKRAPSRKRTLNDILVDTVNRIEKNQDEQAASLTKIMEFVKYRKINEPPPLNWEHFGSLPSLVEKLRSQESEKLELDFETLFLKMLRQFGEMKSEEKSERVRKLIRTVSNRETENLSELLDMFWAEGLQKELGRKSPTVMLHSRSPTPFDEFYKDFLSSPLDCPDQLF